MSISFTAKINSLFVFFQRKFNIYFMDPKLSQLYYEYNVLSNQYKQYGHENQY